MNQWKDQRSYPLSELENFNVDSEILPLLKIINNYYGIQTLYSCSGHGYNHPYLIIQIPKERKELFKQSLGDVPKKPCILTEPDCIEKVYAYQFMVGRLTIEVESEDYTNNDQIRVAFYGANPKRTLEDLVTQSEVFGEQVLTIIESYLNV